MPSCAIPAGLDLDRRTGGRHARDHDRAAAAHELQRQLDRRCRARGDHGAVHATAFRQVAHGARGILAAASIVCVAPNACATASRSPARSSATIGSHPASSAAWMQLRPTPPAPITARLSPGAHLRGVDDRPVAGDHAAGQQARAVEGQLARDRHDLGAVDEHLLGEGRGAQALCDLGAARRSQRAAADRAEARLAQGRLAAQADVAGAARAHERDDDVIARSQAVRLAAHRLARCRPLRDRRPRACARPRPPRRRRRRCGRSRRPPRAP